jgi:hypothetical protein
MPNGLIFNLLLKFLFPVLMTDAMVEIHSTPSSTFTITTSPMKPVLIIKLEDGLMVLIALISLSVVIAYPLMDVSRLKVI